ncbi:hypothetical protein [Borreliella garinii]|uniref:Uncharacterized protein n=1 Tax=Borreliella garinii PBr TaxID=498743 RepID=B8F192_BORGR|nr:hypothetical protein [Borreliella garinii]ACL34684.1 conserved hypothetical protein [Borreliella garinii PBr]
MFYRSKKSNMKNFSKKDRETKTLAQHQIAAKMSEKLFLDIGKALEPMMIGLNRKNKTISYKRNFGAVN